MASDRSKRLEKMKKVMEEKKRKKSPRVLTYEDYTFDVRGTEEYEAKLEKLKEKFLDKV